MKQPEHFQFEQYGKVLLDTDMDVHAVILLSFIFTEILSSRCLRALQPFMPNVCSEQARILTAERQPCVQAFTHLVKVWRQGCTGHAWCMDYERRTVYYIGYRQVYRQDFKTTYKCCPGWSQLNAEAGCIYPLCTYGVCFNGGVCTGHVHQLCDCLPGFNGSNCQYDLLPCEDCMLCCPWGCRTCGYGRDVTDPFCLVGLME